MVQTGWDATIKSCLPDPFFVMPFPLASKSWEPTEKREWETDARRIHVGLNRWLKEP